MKLRIEYDRLPSIEVERHQQDDKGNIFTLLSPLRYGGVDVPVGFDSDGASVPRALWGVVFPAEDNRAMFGAIFHDFCYRTHPATWEKSSADTAFRYLLIEGGVPTFRANLAYWGVRLCGGKAWREGKKR